MPNGQPPKLLHQVNFGLLDNGQVVAQSTADLLTTMKILGLGQSAMADAFKTKAETKIVQAPAGLQIPRG